MRDAETNRLGSLALNLCIEARDAVLTAAYLGVMRAWWRYERATSAATYVAPRASRAAKPSEAFVTIERRAA